MATKLPPVYEGHRINRVNENYHSPNVYVKYGISVNGVMIYFKTQADLKAFIKKENRKKEKLDGLVCRRTK